MAVSQPGEVGSPIAVTEDELRRLLRDALAAEADPSIGFVWQDLDNELAVHSLELRVALREGLLLAALPVQCDQARTQLVVPYALGTESEPAGLIGTAETAARGADPLVVAVWGPTAVAAVWIAFRQVCETVAARAGEDAHCCPMLPGAVWASHGVLRVVPQARHAIDRAARS
ncbi:hypothetical protein [Actinoplanes sp. NBRC 103695]|uniref:hypothetical protein n=1 Tax=Actinoplanes sp. NBRC 103695 TaxID=3032202 RepID=UPI0024A3F4A0|nr:hypothetical protein [Actinoplanes sp. NBRC 103695]GLY99564.1 hypothetical protein Acsp02_68170 [Actinoplanes sp. NBRC 103695]